MVKAALALGLAIIFAATGDVLLSKGMRASGEVKIGRFQEVPPLARRILTNPFVLAGAFSMAIHLGSYATALAWVDVSVANPLTALSYVIATGYAVLFMRERVAFERWTGILLITVGAVLVGLSS